MPSRRKVIQGALDALSGPIEEAPTGNLPAVPVAGRKMTRREALEKASDLALTSQYLSGAPLDLAAPKVQIKKVYVDKPDEAALVYDKMRELYSGQSIFDEDLNDYVSEATPEWLEYERALNRLIYDDLVDDDTVLSLRSFLDEGREYTEGRLGHPSLKELKKGKWGKKLYHGPLGKFFKGDE
tara:strand:- start:38 stop:586 length:549 start_codon:yes stop_codon:yes gene_type:complete